MRRGTQSRSGAFEQAFWRFVLAFAVMAATGAEAQCRSDIRETDKIKDVKEALECWVGSNAKLEAELTRLRSELERLRSDVTSFRSVSAENARLRTELKALQDARLRSDRANAGDGVANAPSSVSRRPQVGVAAGGDERYTITNFAEAVDPGPNAGVGKTLYTPSTFDYMLALHTNGNASAATPQLRAAIRTELNTRELVAREARKLGLDKTLRSPLGTSPREELAYQNVLIKRFLAEWSASHPNERVDEYLRELRSKYGV